MTRSTPVPKRTLAASPWDAVKAAQLIRHVGIVGLAGLVTGLVVGGIGGRVFMRVAAILADDRPFRALTENGNRVGEITFGGTVELLIFIGIFAGALGAVAYVIAEPWLTWAGPLRGLVFSALLLAIASSVAFDPDNFDFDLLGNDPRNVLMLIALYAAFGPILVAVTGLLARRMPAVDPGEPASSVVGYTVLVALGVPFLLLMLLSMFSSGFCECDDPPRLIGVFVVGMGIATLGLRAADVNERWRSKRYVFVFRALGYLCFAGALIAGGIRATVDILAIL